jgi:hypothetical protein
LRQECRFHRLTAVEVDYRVSVALRFRERHYAGTPVVRADQVAPECAYGFFKLIKK